MLVDKPAGMTSHTVVSRLRKKLQTKKIGHAGTLDPTATGLLVICVGYATKISSYVTDLDKTYQCKFELGKTTTTYDSEGEIVSHKDSSHITEQNLRAVFQNFVGHISQKPPIYSAIKIKGKKLYQYARSSTEVEIPCRDVTIHSLDLISFEPPYATLQVSCTKGTYVRSLVHDIGIELGVGAAVERIHRTESSPFSIDKAVTLDALIEMPLEDIQQRMISVTDALKNNFNLVSVDSDEEVIIRQGKDYLKSKIGDNQASFDEDSLFLFVSKESKQEVAIAKWGKQNAVSYLRIL